MKPVAAAAIAVLGLFASCATPRPGTVVVNAQRRFEQQQKGYPDRESRETRAAEQTQAQQQSMLTGKP
jgi:hypothetical protein